MKNWIKRFLRSFFIQKAELHKAVGEKGREKEKESFLSTDSFSKWSQQLEVGQSKTRSFLKVSHMSKEASRLEPASTAVLGHKQGSGKDVYIDANKFYIHAHDVSSKTSRETYIN